MNCVRINKCVYRNDVSVVKDAFRSFFWCVLEFSREKKRLGSHPRKKYLNNYRECMNILLCRPDDDGRSMDNPNPIRRQR